METKFYGNKVTIIGAGFVGATTAYALMMGGTASEIVLVDINQKRLEGEVMDLNHGIAFVPPVRIRSGTYEDCADSNVVIITAGVGQKPGETRIDLLKRNIEVFYSITPKIVEYNKDCIILVVTNPVDILTYATLKISGCHPARSLVREPCWTAPGSDFCLDSTARLPPRISMRILSGNTVTVRYLHGVLQILQACL